METQQGTMGAVVAGWRLLDAMVVVLVETTITLKLVQFDSTLNFIFQYRHA